ncbi:MAG TPA: hypothetical protein VIO58_10615 [Candidatus Methanoperedens sp.]
MDCCGSKKDDTKKDDPKIENSKQIDGRKEQSHGGCGGGAGMWLHLIVMLILFAILYFKGN